jgi:DNA-binding CsgD family transcriptional regulator
MTPYKTSEITALNLTLANVIEGNVGAQGLIEAAHHIIPFTAAFCIVNRPTSPPIYLCDTYPAGAAKDAVQLYVASTYLLNPLYNAYLDGLSSGLHSMADLAPDNWHSLQDEADIHQDTSEEIGYRTTGWPTGLQELSFTVGLPEGFLGEISFARPAKDGGFEPNIIERLHPFLPLFATAFRAIWANQHTHVQNFGSNPKRLEYFARDILTNREAEVVHMILKGHSSLSVGLNLGIAVPTVKTHRQKAYSKLGISTQAQLFSTFLKWQQGASE